MTAPGKDEKEFFTLIRACVGSRDMHSRVLGANAFANGGRRYPEAVNLFESYCKRRDRAMLRRLYAFFARCALAAPRTACVRAATCAALAHLQI